MTASSAGDASPVLPALELLAHTVRIAPRDLKSLLNGPARTW